ncbi:Eukaryotic translation initiation factor 3 subunit L [Microtus ochrogaster]|uniref:Eukaryotic translation initiation factor 3 subunit L n=1 Tax=Microtus ochrogaster TaxID=79684 RepID=A0A8J6L3U9_MICOH|nr:Eukaryotic translation initiation factor 3 subunit L [Microtus ochrogaster]
MPEDERFGIPTGRAFLTLSFFSQAAYDPYAYPGDYDMHTGDPKQDLAYERQYEQQTYQVIPEVIKNFIQYFHKTVSDLIDQKVYELQASRVSSDVIDQKVYEIQDIYENSWTKLTERFFKNTPWPEAEAIAPQVGNDADGPAPLELPNQWLWDIIDEFIYQFQSFSQYRCKTAKKSEEEIDFLRSNPKIWNVHSVLNVLHSLVDKSNINRQLEVYTSGGDPESVAGEYGRHSLYKMLGYFSLVGLLRLHSLLGDYYQAIKVLENIELNKKSMYSRVPECQVTTYYYVGFAYLMMRRYQDAIRVFANILLYIQRTKSMFQRTTYKYEMINKQNEQMHALLAIALTMYPMRIDESIHLQLREKYGDKMLRMQKGDPQVYEELFSYACPKFLSPVVPNYDNVHPNYHKEPFLQQLKVFSDEVQQQAQLSTIRSFLKLYTTMPVAKLAGFLDLTEQEFRIQLLVFKHKMKNLVWTSGISALDGEFQSASEVDFYIDKDMIHIADTKVARRYGDFFIRQIHKFEEHKMKNLVWTSGISALDGEFQSASEVDFYIDKDMIHIADTKVARRYGDFFIRQIHKFEEDRDDGLTGFEPKVLQLLATPSPSLEMYLNVLYVLGKWHTTEPNSQAQ